LFKPIFNSSYEISTAIDGISIRNRDDYGKGFKKFKIAYDA